MHRYSTCRKTENCYVVRITSKGTDVILYPLKRGNLIHVGVATFKFFRMFFAQRRMCEMTKATKAIINIRQYDALFSKSISCRSGAGTTTTRETTSVNPNHYRQF